MIFYYMAPHWLKVFDILIIFTAAILLIWAFISDGEELFTLKYFLTISLILLRYLVIGGWHYREIRKIPEKSIPASVFEAISKTRMYLWQREKFLKAQINEKL